MNSFKLMVAIILLKRLSMWTSTHTEEPGTKLVTNGRADDPPVPRTFTATSVINTYNNSY